MCLLVFVMTPLENMPRDQFLICSKIPQDFALQVLQMKSAFNLHRGGERQEQAVGLAA